MFRQFGMICAVLAAMMVPASVMAQENPALALPSEEFDSGSYLGGEEAEVPADPRDYANEVPMWVFNGKLQPAPLMTEGEVEAQAIKRLFGCKPNPTFAVCLKDRSWVTTQGGWSQITGFEPPIEFYTAYLWYEVTRADGKPNDMEAYLEQFDGTPGKMVYMTCSDPVRDFVPATVEEHVRITCTVNAIVVRYDFWLERDYAEET